MTMDFFTTHNLSERDIKAILEIAMIEDWIVMKR